MTWLFELSMYFWDLFQVLFSGFISGLEGWGVQVGVGFLVCFSFFLFYKFFLKATVFFLLCS